MGPRGQSIFISWPETSRGAPSLGIYRTISTFLRAFRTGHAVGMTDFSACGTGVFYVFVRTPYVLPLLPSHFCYSIVTVQQSAARTVSLQRYAPPHARA